jgi:predicted nucleic acid-binding protein
MPFVLDASIAGCWAFQDESHPYADLALDRLLADTALVPVIWWFEVRNILVKNERRKRIAPIDTLAFLRTISSFTINIEPIPGEAELLRLARVRGLTFYDAAYLELAQRNQIPLATLDTNLASAAKAEGVPIIGEATGR